MAEGDTPPKSGGGKGNAFFKKYKWWFVGGAGIVLIVIFLAVKKANNNSNAGTDTSNPTTAGMGINPATGYLYGSPADLAAQGASSSVTGTPGPPGPQGPAGPQGPPGTPGKTGGGSKPPINGGHPPVQGKPHPVPKTYVVKPGDDLSKIARKFDISGGWQQLYSLNRHVIGGNPNLIHPGQKLTL